MTSTADYGDESGFDSSMASQSTSRSERAMNLDRLKKKDLIYRELEIFVNQKFVEAYTDLQRRVAEIRRQCSAISINYSQNFLQSKLCDLLDLVPENGRTTLPNFLMAASVLGDEDRMNNNGSPDLFCTPALPKVTALPPKVPKSAVNSTKKAQKGDIFPSSKDMFTTCSSNETPSPHGSGVFHFGAKKVPITPKQKPARLLKPGEAITFSAAGSPIHVQDSKFVFPSTPGHNATGVDKPVRLQVPDLKGNVIDVDLIYRGHPDEKKDEQAFRGFVTDVRGLISTRSTVRSSKRVQNTRMPVTSAKKRKPKPQWHQ